MILLDVSRFARLFAFWALVFPIIGVVIGCLAGLYADVGYPAILFACAVFAQAGLVFGLIGGLVFAFLLSLVERFFQKNSYRVAFVTLAGLLAGLCAGKVLDAFALHYLLQAMLIGGIGGLLSSIKR